MASHKCDFLHNNCSSKGSWRTDTSFTACDEFVRTNSTAFDYKPRS